MSIDLKKDHSGFTMIELIIVMTMVIIVISSVAPGLNAIASKDVYGTRFMYSDIVYNLQTALWNASSWFGGLSIEKWENGKVELLPEDFLVAFQSDTSNTPRSGSMYDLSIQTRKNWSTEYMRLIQKKINEYKRPWIYLRKITARKDDNDSWVEVGNFTVSFRNPTGNMSFFFDNPNFFSEGNIVIQENKTDTINEFPKITSDKIYSRVDLEFYNQDIKRIFTVKIYKDKQFYVNLD